MVSPATKLLEKRRKMYEIHEAFESQKDEFKKYKQKDKNLFKSVCIFEYGIHEINSEFNTLNE